MRKFNNAKVGDDIICEYFGKGKIVAVFSEDDYEFPIVVEFENRLRPAYTMYGVMNKLFIPSITYINKPTIEEHNDFSFAKVGDPVYSLKYGWGIVTQNLSETSCTYPIKVSFSKNNLWYAIKGKLNINYITPDLYWDKPEIIAPSPPKRKIEKKLDVWVNHINDVLKPLIWFIEPCHKGSIKGTLTYEIEE